MLHLQETAPTTFTMSRFISLMLQFISMLVGLTLATAMVDFLTNAYNVFLVDSDLLRSVRQYCGPVAAIGIFVEIAAVLVAGQSR